MGYHELGGDPGVREPAGDQVEYFEFAGCEGAVGGGRLVQLAARPSGKLAMTLGLGVTAGRGERPGQLGAGGCRFVDRSHSLVVVDGVEGRPDGRGDIALRSGDRGVRAPHSGNERRVGGATGEGRERIAGVTRRG